MSAEAMQQPLEMSEEALAEFERGIGGSLIANTNRELLRRCLVNESYARRIAAFRGPMFTETIDKLRASLESKGGAGSEGFAKWLNVYRYMVEEDGDLKLTGASSTKVSSQHA